MAITFIAFTDSGAVASPMSAAKPTGVMSGDKMLALVADVTSSGATLGAPAGWTQIGSTNQFSFGGITTALYYKDDLGTAGPYAFTTNSGGSAEVIVLGYRGAAIGAVDDSSITQQTTLSATSQSSTGVTPSKAGDLLVYMAACNSTLTWTPAAGYTSRITGSNQYCMDLIGAPSGATGTVAATTNSGTRSGIWMVAIQASTGHMHQRMVL